MKKLLLPVIVLFTGIFVACSDNESEISEIVPQELSRVIQANTEMVSELLVNDELLEESVDSVLNLGSEDYPAYYHVNKSHKLNGEDILPGIEDMNCAFRTLNLEEYERLIKVFALVMTDSQSQELTLEQKQRAYYIMLGYLNAWKVEAAQLAYLVQDNKERMKAAFELAESYVESRTSDMPELGMLFDHMIVNNIDPVECRDRLNAMMEVESRGATAIVKGVVKGLVIASKIIITIIENSKPIVDLNSQYASYLNANDIDAMNYINATQSLTPTYEFRYGAKNTPMAQAKFVVEAYGNAKHAIYNGKYISRVGMLVTDVRCTGGMHVVGETYFYAGEKEQDSNGELIAVGPLEVVIRYGDCCCFAKIGRVKFDAKGNGNIVQTSKTNGKDKDW